MSIEKNIERIANALETIASHFGNVPQVQEVPAPQQAQPAPAPVQEAAPAPAPVVEAMTAQDMDAELGKEVQRLGSPDKIFEIIREYGATGLNQIDPSKYSEILAKVRAL